MRYHAHRGLLLVFVLGMGLPVGAATISGSATGLSSHQTLVDFGNNDYSLNPVTQITDQYADQGVTFGDTWYYRDGETAAQGYLQHTTTGVQPGPIYFEQPVTDVALVITNNGPTTTIASYLDGGLVESFTPATSGSPLYYGFTNTNIDEIRLTVHAVGTNYNTAIDNIQLVAIPEPATAVMVLAGLPWLLIRRR